MPKGDRPNPSPIIRIRKRYKYSKGVNPYIIPATAKEAIGERGEPKSMVRSAMDSNPNYEVSESLSYKEFTHNCQRCAPAFEMNRRGYDVEALPTYKGDTMPINNNWATAFKGMKADRVGGRNAQQAIENLKNKMREWGDGARAIVSVEWRGRNSGHVFVVENSKGFIHTFEPQNRNAKVNDALLNLYMSQAKPSSVELWRTDDKEIGENMRYMVRKRP